MQKTRTNPLALPPAALAARLADRVASRALELAPELDKLPAANRTRGLSRLHRTWWLRAKKRRW